MNTNSLTEVTEDAETKEKRQRPWVMWLVSGLTLVVAIAGIIYGWQMNLNYQNANQSLSTVQAAEQLTRYQLATAVSAEQQSRRQQANAESAAQQALSAQATAESAAQQSATAEAQSKQANETLMEQTRQATSRELAGKALDILPIDPQLSAHLALQAINTAFTFEAEYALHQVLPNLRLLKSTTLTDVVPNVKNWNAANFSLAMDGKLLVAGTPDGIELVDLADGTHSMLGQAKDCDWVSASHDGRRLFAECADGQQAWEIETRKLLYKLSDYREYTRGYDLIPTLSTFPVLFLRSAANGIIHARDVVSGTEQFALSAPKNYPYWRIIVPNIDESRLATFDDTGMVTLFDLNTGQELANFNPQINIKYMAFSPDGTRLAMYGMDPNKIQVWDLSSLSSEPSLFHEIIPTKSCRDYCIILFSPDGAHLAFGSGDGQVQVWRSEMGTDLLTLAGHTMESWPLAWSQDGSRLYTGSWDGTLKEWDVSPGGALVVLSGRSGSVPYSPDGERLAIMSGDGLISVVDSRTGEELLSWQAYSEWETWSDIAWSPDGERLATQSSQLVKIWEAATGKLLKQLPAGYPGSLIAWSPDSSRLAINAFGILYILDTESWKELIRIDTLGGSTLVFNPDGTRIASGDSMCVHAPSGKYSECSYELGMWDAATGSELFHINSYSGQASSPAGKAYAPARPANLSSVMVYQTVGAQLSQPAHSGWTTDIALGMNIKPMPLVGYTDAATVGVSIYAGEVYAHNLRPSYIFATYFPFELAFSPDGQYLAAGTPGGVILFKVTEDGVEQERTLPGMGLAGGFSAVAFSSDGSLLAAGAEAGKIIVWDMQSGLVRWEGGTSCYHGRCHRLSFSPDGAHLASSVWNGVTTIHVLALDELTALVRAHIVRPLTPQECLTYLHQETCPAWP
jgi:WD40 repeat protein